MIIGYIEEAAWMLAKCYVSYRLVKAASKERFSKQWISIFAWCVLSVSAVIYLVVTLYHTEVVGNNYPTIIICASSVILSAILFRNKPDFLNKTIGICLFFELDDLMDYFLQTMLYVFLDTAGEGTARLFQFIGIPRGLLLLCYTGALLSMGGRIAWVYRKYIVPTWLTTWMGLIPVAIIWFIGRYFQRVYYQTENLVKDSFFLPGCLHFFQSSPAL